jgi:hypothetical protein
MTTGYAPLYGSLADAHSLLINRTTLIRHLQRAFRRRGLRVQAALILALNGAAAGGTASASRYRVQMTPGNDERGGQRTIESVSLINRATTSADETAIDGIANPAFAPARLNGYTRY